MFQHINVCILFYVRSVYFDTLYRLINRRIFIRPGSGLRRAPYAGKGDSARRFAQPTRCDNMRANYTTTRQRLPPLANVLRVSGASHPHLVTAATSMYFFDYTARRDNDSSTGSGVCTNMHHERTTRGLLATPTRKDNTRFVPPSTDRSITYYYYYYYIGTSTTKRKNKLREYYNNLYVFDYLSLYIYMHTSYNHTMKGVVTITSH